MPPRLGGTVAFVGRVLVLGEWQGDDRLAVGDRQAR